jgi:hypothetical protein
MSLLLGDKTVYIFGDGAEREEFQGNGFALPYVYFTNCAFTHDHTGANLPTTRVQWTFILELQPGKPLDMPADRDAIKRGLQEKGWVIARVELGASAYSRFAGKPSPQHLSPVAQELLAGYKG